MEFRFKPNSLTPEQSSRTQQHCLQGTVKPLGWTSPTSQFPCRALYWHMPYNIKLGDGFQSLHFGETVAMDTTLPELFNDSRKGRQREELESCWCQKLLSPHSLRWGRPGTWSQLPSCLLISVSGCTLLGSHGYNPRLPWILILNSFHLNTKESVWYDFLSPRSWLWSVSSHTHPQRHLRAFQKPYLFKKNLLFSPFSLASLSL